MTISATRSTHEVRQVGHYPRRSSTDQAEHMLAIWFKKARGANWFEPAQLTELQLLDEIPRMLIGAKAKALLDQVQKLGHCRKKPRNNQTESKPA